MAISLRTRLFLIVAVVLAAAVAASSVLTRQATLVEVREIVTRSAPANEVSDGVAAAVQERIGEARDLTAVGPILEASEKATGRPVLIIDTDRRIRAASNARLAAAELERATSDGHLSLRIRDAGREAVIEVRGTPTAVLRDRSGAAVGSLHVLPSPDQENVSLQERARVPVWMLATLSTAVVGLALTFVVARRVLGPVSELTGAVRRMELGDLDVRVARLGRATRSASWAGRSTRWPAGSPRTSASAARWSVMSRTSSGRRSPISAARSRRCRTA